MAPRPVDASKLATVERGTMARSVVATGKIEPITKVEIKSKANGIIERLNIDVDQVVEAGAVLAELDKEHLRARVREARANLQAARAALEAAEAQLKKNKVEAEAPDVAFAQPQLRARAISCTSRSCCRRRRSTTRRARWSWRRTARRAAQVQLGVSKAQGHRGQAKVAQAQAAVERAQEELANATIKAPIRGTVLTRDVEIGSPVSSILNLGAAATLVMTLGDIDQVFVRGKVDEADIGRVRLGQPARITVETFKDRKFEGKVTQISPIGAEKDNVTTLRGEGLDRQSRQRAQGQHDGERRDRPRGAPQLADRPRGGDHLRREAQPDCGRRRRRRPRTAAGRSTSRPASATAPGRRCSTG